MLTIMIITMPYLSWQCPRRWNGNLSETEEIETISIVTPNLMYNME